MLLLHAFRAGDPTEDPQHPKIIWPSATDCPNCRTDRMDLFNLDPQIAFVEGQLWNLTMLVQHNIKVYGTDQLVSTIRREDETLKNIGKLFLLLLLLLLQLLLFVLFLLIFLSVGLLPRKRVILHCIVSQTLVKMSPRILFS